MRAKENVRDCGTERSGEGKQIVQSNVVEADENDKVARDLRINC